MLSKHFFAVILFVMLMAFGIVQPVFAATGWLPGWNFRKSHIIQANSGAGTGYQVMVTIHYNSGADSGEDVYLNSNCQTNFGDIRFTADDGVTSLNYWLEPDAETDGGQAVFWVQVSNDLSTTDQTIYVYYGDSSVTTTSNGNNTFLFFDDFSGTLSKWTTESSSGAYPEIISSGILRCGGGSTSSPYGFTSLGSSPTYSGFSNNAVEFRYRVATDAISEVTFRGKFSGNTGYKGRSDQRTGQGGQSFQTPPYSGWGFIGAGADGQIPAADTWYRGTITAYNSVFNYYRDGTLMVSVTDFAYAGPGEIALQNHYGDHTDYNWVAVRKFASPEPVNSTWGSEEISSAFTLVRRTLNFDGAGTVNVSDSTSLDLTTSGTIEAWIYPTSFTASAGIVFKGTSQICYGFGLGGAGAGGVFTDGSSQNIEFMLGNTTGSNYHLAATSNSLLLDKWCHVACVWDASVSPYMVIYINGVQEASSPSAISNIRTNNNNLQFGMQSLSPAGFSGNIDEVRIWNTARTQTDIQANMCHTLVGNEAGLMGYWRFDEKSGNNCLDYSGHGNTGTIANLSGGNYRKSHVIDSASGAGAGYQVRITAYYGSGTDSGENVYLSGHCQTNFGDIRFTASDGVTPLDYWMESETDSDHAVFWIKVSNDLSAANQTIYIEYGGLNLITTSNGDNTFLFFDDFLGGLSKWTPESSSGAYPEIISSGILRCGGGVTGGQYGWTSLGSSPTYTGFSNNAVEFRYRGSANAICEVAFRGNYVNNTGYKGRSDQRAGEGQSFLKPPYRVGQWQFIPGAGADGDVPAMDTWYRGTITADGSNLKYYRDGVLKRSVNDTDYAGPDEISLQNHYGDHTDYNWVAVRKFVSPEPAHGTWGSEEHLGTFVPDVVRQCSSAPIGDFSASDYTGSGPGGFSVTLAAPAPDTDSITIKQDSGTWSIVLKSGIQVYRVDQAPENADGPFYWQPLSTAKRYWGTFITGGTTPTYMVTYKYSGYPGIIDEDQLKLAFREQNNCSTWYDLNATLNTTLKTLTHNGLSGTEFILSFLVEPRNAIKFDGPTGATPNEYISITAPRGGDFDMGNQGSIEAWVNVNSFNDNSAILYRWDSTNGDAYKLQFGTLAGGDQQKIKFVLTDSGGISSIETSTTALSAGKWYNVAGVWNTATPFMGLYINGVLEDSSGTARAARPSDSLTIGSQGGINTINGTIDEVRIWDITRTTAQIEGAMCHKLSGTEITANLMGYWRFDKDKNSSTYTICEDYSSYGNIGTMTNFPYPVSRNNRVCSEAPIGDASADIYSTGSATPGSYSISISHTDGDSFEATGDGGAWSATTSGLQVYRIDAPPVYISDIFDTPYVTPNGLTPPSGWSSIDYHRYWGVFVTGGSSPTYTAVYHYAGNPSVPVNQNVIGLAKRADCCDRIWIASGAALDTGAQTLTIMNQIGTEYALGGDEEPLAIKIVSFMATAKDDHIHLAWGTATEIDTIGFYLLRSTNPDTGFKRIPDMEMIPSKAQLSVSGSDYEYDDSTVDQTTSATYYYKLEEVHDAASQTTVYDTPVAGPVKFPPPDPPGGNSNSACFIETIMTH